MVTLKLVLSGVLVLATKGTWPAVEEIRILAPVEPPIVATHGGGHEPMLLLSTDVGIDGSVPDVAFEIATIDCQTKNLGRPYRAIPLRGTHLSFVDPVKSSYSGSTPGSRNPKEPKAHTCSRDPKKELPCAELILRASTLLEDPTLDSGCLAFPSKNSCVGKIGAAATLGVGALQSGRYSCGAPEPLTWDFRNAHGKPIGNNAHPGPHAGAAVIEIEFPGDYVPVLLERDGVRISFKLKPPSPATSVELHFENSPLAEYVSGALCASACRGPVDHIALAFNLAKDPNQVAKGFRPFAPRDPAMAGTHGVRSVGNPMCEPVVGYEY